MEGFMRWASRLLHEMHKPLTVSTGREMWANSMHDKLWVWWTSTGSQNLLPKQIRSLLFATTRWSRKVKTCEELETSAKLWVLVSNISSPRLKRRYTRFFFFVYFAAFRTARSHSFFFAVHVGVLHVFKDIQLKVISIKSHGKSLLFGYYKLGFRCLELNLFFASLLRFERL